MAMPDEAALAAIDAEHGATGSGPTEAQLAAIDAEHTQPYQEPTGLGGKTLGILSKALNAIGGVVKVPVGLAADAITGKPVLTGDEIKRQYDPTTFQNAPDYSEMMKRVGIANPSWSFDKINPPTINPRTGEPRPRITDILPNSVGGVADMALNPANWPGASRLIGFGAKAATPTEVALEASEKGLNPTQAVLNMQAPVSGAMDTLANIPSNPISASLRALGKKLYSSQIDPILTQGTKAGKDASEIADTLYRMGITTPSGLGAKAADQSGKIMNVVNDITQIPKGSVSIEDVLQPAQDFVNKYRGVKDAEVQALVEKMQKRVDSFRDIAYGKESIPGTPPTPESWSASSPKSAFEVPPDSTLAPKVNYTPATPGVPEVPGVQEQPYTVGDLQKVKQASYLTQPSGNYNPLTKTPIEEQLEKLLAQGQKLKIENELNRLKPGLGDKVEQMNADVGNSVSTKRGQATAEAQYNRNANAAVNPTKGLKTLAAALGGFKGLMTKTGLEAAQNLTMPLGYGMRTVGESQYAPLLDMAARQMITNKQKGEQ